MLSYIFMFSTNNINYINLLININLSWIYIFYDYWYDF